jgi:hypothetical protein
LFLPPISISAAPLSYTAINTLYTIPHFPIISQLLLVILIAGQIW